MSLRVRYLAAVGVVVAAGIGGAQRIHLPIAHAQQTWNVQVGSDVDGGTSSANNFFPSVVTLTQGDTVSWTFPSVEPHTVTFDNGVNPPLFATIVPGPNPGELDLSKPFLPAGLDQIQGVFNPTVQISSGVPTDPPDQRQPFTLTFNQPGVYAYDCAIHGPLMHGTIIVEPSGASTPETPAQASARGKADLQTATTDASAPESQPTPGSLTLSTGQTVFSADAGAQPGPNISALKFFPSNVTIHRGDTVTFTNPDPLEIHTVTFTSGAPPPNFIDIRPQPNGPPQIIFPADVVTPQGGNDYTGTGLLSSGLLFPGNSYSITFDVPPGKYTYVCLLHGGDPQNMQGTITVQ